MAHEIIQPEGWAPAKGYANGVLAEAGGRTLYVAGQVAWDAEQNMVSDEFATQFRQALANVVAVVRAAGGEPEHVVRMTGYLTDKHAYLASLKEVGAAYRELMGRNFPAMAFVVVAGLIEDRAQIEIEATAVLPG